MDKNAFFYLYKNKLFNQFHAIKTISSCCEKYKLKHEAELFSKSRNYSGCFQPLGQMSYYLGSCIPKSFLSPTGMHALGLLKCIRNIPNRPFFSNDFTFWLITHSHFSNKYLFTNKTWWAICQNMLKDTDDSDEKRSSLISRLLISGFWLNLSSTWSPANLKQKIRKVKNTF